jgi:hypothetical protein
LERELAAFGAKHLQGDSQVVGNFTSGGTESIILAVKAARDAYRQTHPQIHAPEMILPATAHAAFQKAAHIHLSINASNVGWEDALLANLAECVEIARQMPEGELVGFVKQSLSGMGLSAISEADIMNLMAAAGVSDGALPSRMADINGLLDALPAHVRETVLTSVVNDVFSQT